MMRLICITGAKGGVGKTTTAINLGAALNYFGKNITVIDANLTTPDIGIHLGFPIVPVSLHDVLKGRNKITDAIYQHPSGAKIIPASISLHALKNTNPGRLPGTIQNLSRKSSCDFLILDSSAGLGREALFAMKSVDEVLIVTNPELSAVTDALKTIKLAQELGKEIIGVVLTKTNPKNIDMSIKNIETLLDYPVIAVVPEDRAVKFSIAKRDAVVHTHPKSAAAICYKKLAAYLIGRTYEEEIEDEEKNIFQSFADAVLEYLGLK